MWCCLIFIFYPKTSIIKFKLDLKLRYVAKSYPLPQNRLFLALSPVISTRIEKRTVAAYTSTDFNYFFTFQLYRPACIIYVGPSKFRAHDSFDPQYSLPLVYICCDI